MFHTMITNGIAAFGIGMHAMCTGLTLNYSGKFQKETYFDLLMKYKVKNTHS